MSQLYVCAARDPEDGEREYTMVGMGEHGNILCSRDPDQALELRWADAVALLMSLRRGDVMYVRKVVS